MAILIKKHRLLYLAQPRTASNSIAEALLGIGGKAIGGHHGFGFEELPKHNLDRKDLTVFSAVRNHYDVLTTIWLKIIVWKRKDNITFKSWVQQICAPTISKHVKFLFEKNDSGRSVIQRRKNKNYLYHHHALVSDKILLFENLQSELNNLLTCAGAPRVWLQRVNATPHRRPYQDHYGKATKLRVAEWFGDELQTYGYNFDNGAVRQPQDNKSLLGYGRSKGKLTGTLPRTFPGYPNGSFE